MTDLIYSLITSAVSAVLGYLSGRKRYNADVKGVILENVEKAISIYKDALDDLQARFEKRIEDLERQLKDCQERYLNK
jgi:hypothetical protein